MNKLSFRKVSMADCNLLFEWINDSECRQNSFHQESIPYKEHLKWFCKCISSSDINIFILLDDDIPVGQIRVEKVADIGYISYSVDKAYRGKGYGKVLLQSVEKAMLNIDETCISLVGKVKINNIASQRVFQDLGYICSKDEQGFVYQKTLVGNK